MAGRSACIEKVALSEGRRTYHVPGMPYYDQTRAGEFLCTEAEARAGGYRRPRLAATPSAPHCPSGPAPSLNFAPAAKL